MSDRSGPPSDEGEGDEIRPHGEDRDSSEESSDEDPEEARRIAEGFIQDDDDDDDEEEDEDEARRRRRRERKRRKKRERQRREREEAELSEDELELLQENRGLAGPSRDVRPFKRAKRQDEDVDDEERLPTLQDIFRDEEERRAMEDDDEDDLGDFIEEDEEEEEARGETEEQRRERRRAEKQRRREAAKARPDAAGMDRGSWDEIFAVFGDGQDYDWAMEGEDGEYQDEEEESAKKDLRLEDVFDPAEIKARRLQDEDKAIAQADRPERHQLVNSTLSDNPVLAPTTLFPTPAIAAGWAYNKISDRTKYIFCNMLTDGSWPKPTDQNPYPAPPPRRNDLTNMFVDAVRDALDMMFVQHLEVPYIWHYKRDVLSVLENRGQSSVQFLERDELWTLYTLGVRWRAISARNEQIQTTWKKIQEQNPELQNEYLERNLIPSVCMMSIEAAAEGYAWLQYHYPEEIRRIKEDEVLEEGSKRLPERSVKDDIRRGPIMKLVEEFGINVTQIAITFNDPTGNPTPPETSSRMPLAVAEEFAGPGTYFATPEDALKAASDILVTEFSKDPSIRQQAREFMDACGTVSVIPTDRGMSVIDPYHLYYTFKFLTKKPILAFEDSPQFLHMLKAEEEGLINIVIEIGDYEKTPFLDALSRCVQTNEYGEVATAWNELRKDICVDLIDNHLIPAAARWARELMKGHAEDLVADHSRQELEYRVNVRPYATPTMDLGETPSVLALTNGRGDFKDAIMAVMLDDEGNIRTQTKFDNLKDEADRQSFIEMVERRKPKVVVLGGLSVQTAKLRDDVQYALRQLASRDLGENEPAQEGYASRDEYEHAKASFDERLRPYLTPCIFANDATARQYMLSDEAKQEYPTLPVNGRYALALARYVQNPLNAYCKLGKEITSITFQEHHQKLIPQEKLLVHLERGLVNSVCFMGIEVNSCAADPYQRTMLPFIAGLGPRKADALVNAINRHGSLINRGALSQLGIFGPTILENVWGFLSIESDLTQIMLEPENPESQPDPLDATRIHPADYEFAQKMCQDALDLDAEDVADQHKSAAVQQLMLDDDRARKMGDLNLDDFAFNIQRQGEGNKRHTLGEIVNELISYRSDRRPPFNLPTDWEVVKMLTGETERTIGPGLRVTATVRKALSSRVFCALDSGIDAVLERDFVADDTTNLPENEVIFKPKQPVKAMVLHAEPAAFQVRLSMRESDLRQAVPFVQPFRIDPYNDGTRQAEWADRAAQKKRRQAGKVKRVVNHPNWHVMNSGQAEQYLASQQRGDVVIRPSSKGSGHIAVTWKVDDDVYQHIDVQELDKPNEYTLGKILRIGGKYSYSDLDDLIINHVKATARKFDELQMHEKYRPEDELEGYLKNYVQAHPGRSMYGFSIDSARPGNVKLCFLNKSTKDGGVIQEWPVRVLPGAYKLGNAEVPGVTELCNAFKTQYSARLADQGSGGKTPGIRSAKTPMGGRTPGGRTPGMMRGGATPMYGAPPPSRTPMMPGRTPNPYAVPHGAYGGATPAGGRPPFPPNGPPGGFGMPPPPHGQGYPPGPPPPGMGGPSSGVGMNPERAAMIARQGGQY